LKNKRLFDSRRKHIYQLVLIDSFLRNNVLTNESDMKASAIINDNWDYANNPIRKSGWYVNVGLQISMNNQNNESYRLVDSINHDKYHSVIERYSGTAFINYEYSNPINLHWQQSANFKTYVGASENNDSIFNFYRYRDSKTDSIIRNTKSSSRLYYYGAKLGYSLGFYPNSRTSIVWSTNFDLWRDIFYEYEYNDVTSSYNNNSPFFSDKWNFWGSSGIIADYFISPRVKLNISLSVNYNNIENNSFISYCPNVIPNSYFTNSKGIFCNSNFKIVINIF